MNDNDKQIKTFEINCVFKYEIDKEKNKLNFYLIPQVPKDFDYSTFHELLNCHAPLFITEESRDDAVKKVSDAVLSNIINAVDLFEKNKEK